MNWNSIAPQILWNPRLPAEEKARLEGLFLTAPTLKRHFWLSTSGSSGLAKWVALSQEAIWVAADGANRHLEVCASDIWLKVIPSFHVGGLGILARAQLSNARVFESDWDPYRFCEIASTERVTLSALVPAQVYDLVQAGLQAPPSVRAVIVGGGALAEKLNLRARDLGWKLLPSYGMTECCSQVATADWNHGSSGSGGGDGNPRKEERENPVAPMLLLPHVEAREVEGRLAIRSEALLTGYALERSGKFEWIDPKNQGWFLTEDLGRVSGRELWPMGRQGSFVKMGGESVDFSRLEKIFEEARLEVSARQDSVIIAVPDPRMGHLTHLVIEEETQNQELMNLRMAFDRRVLPVERIRQVHRVQKIPRSSLGKLLKQELLASASLMNSQRS